MIFCLWHEYELDGVDEVKEIGVFTTKSRAQAALKAVRKQPGFREHPRGFHIGEVLLDLVSWQEGFVTIRSGSRID